MTKQKIVLKPGETVDIVLVDVLDNGYPDETGSVEIHWQERDAPDGQIATKSRELQMETRLFGGRVGPIVVRHR